MEKKNLAFLGYSIFLLSCSSGNEQKTDTEIWEDLCAVATIEENEGTSYWTTAVIPIDLYCAHFDCAANIEAYQEQFSTCDELDSDWPTCAWKRQKGCGLIQFEAPCDESCSHHVAFDEATGSLLGMYWGSDSPMKICGASDLRIGEFKDYFYKPDVCEQIERTYCCEAD